MEMRCDERGPPRRPSRRRAAGVLGVAALVVSIASVSAAGAELRCRAGLLDGSDVEGKLLKLGVEAIEVEGRERPIAYHELRELAFLGGGETAAAPGDAPTARAFVQFASGEALPGRVVASDGKTIRVSVRGAPSAAQPAGEDIGEVAVPITALRAFRLREANASDAIFEDTLKGTPPASDLFFVRRGAGLIRIEGLFRGLDAEAITIEYRSESQRIRRDRLLGAVFAPVAGTAVETGEEGVLELRGGGRLPVRARGLARTAADAPALEVAVHGEPWTVELRHVERLLFASDRIRFLSDLEPSRVKEVPFLDSVFPYRKDGAVGGGPLKLRGVEYKKGLGMHSRSTIEYELSEGFASFVARVGIDDAVGRRGAATVRVLANGRKVLEAEIRGGEAPVEVLVPILGVKTLAIEADFGADGSDVADHVDWVDARLVKPTSPKDPPAAGSTEAKSP